MRRAYELFLRLYPRKQRELFGGEMAQVFEEAGAERRSQGRFSYAAFVLREIAGLLLGAAGAWLGRRRSPQAATAGEASAVPAEVVEAQRLIEASIAGMVHAIAHHQFQKARFYSYAERKARQKLCRLKERHGIKE